MVLTSLSLKNFRNYKKRTFTFSAKTTVIVGPNATGKTNLLEAVHLLASGKSFRAEVEREMIAYGEEIARVEAKVKSSDREEGMNLEIVLTRGQVQGGRTPYKKFLINDTVKAMNDFVGSLRSVIFWPEDLELITSTPSRRRKYLNSVLSLVDREYRRTLLSYDKGLRSRNRLLERIRDGQAKQNQLLFWDQLLIKHGGYLTKKREEFLNFVNNRAWSAVGEQFEVFYEVNFISEARLAQYREKEVQIGMTLVGPHRDDFKLKVKNQKSKMVKSRETGAFATANNGRNLHSFGSRGEQRLAVLWLKFSELAFIKEMTGQHPIFLLDDILSELDRQHRRYVLETTLKQQTIITTTDIHLLEADKKDFKLIRLDEKP